MKTLIIFDLATGRITGRLTTSDPVLTNNVVELDDALVDQPVETTMRVRLLTKTLIAKNEVKATASKIIFMANGTDACTITFSGLSGEVDVVIDHSVVGQITDADPTVTVTSDVARIFAVHVDSLIDYSWPITVTAQ